MMPTSFQTVSEFESWLVKELQRPFYNFRGVLLTAALSSDHKLLVGSFIFLNDNGGLSKYIQHNEATLAEEWVPIDSAFNRIHDVLCGNGNVCNVNINNIFRHSTINKMTGPAGTYSGHSEWDISFPVVDDSLYPSQDSLLKYGLPPYFSIGHAAHDFVFKRSAHWSLGQMERGGQLLIIIPDTRAMLSAKWDRVKSTVIVEISGNVDWDKVELQILTISTPIYRHNIKAVPGIQEWKIPEDTEYILLALVHQDDSLLSRIRLTPQWLSVGYDGLGKDILDEYSKDLNSGENDQVEFKPFIEIGNKKEHEIIETIIAFANTNGGRLYIGIDNYGSPIGEHGLFKSGYNGQMDVAIENVRKHIVRVIQDRVKPVPVFKTSIGEYNGKKFVVAIVDVGHNRPYSTHNNDVFIRKGSTNRRPDPHTEWPQQFGQIAFGNDFIK